MSTSNPPPAPQPLPAPRALLTSILNTLFSYPPSSTPLNTHTNTRNNNPLRALPPEQKALLSTLHVLLPPPVLLLALDLLDRGAVVRVMMRGEGEGDEGGGEEDGGGGKEEQLSENEKRNRIYIVRSSQPSKSRGRSGGGWQDTAGAGAGPCAAFAFAAFPAFASGGYGEGDEEGESMGVEGERNDEEWSYGGMRREEEGDENPPPICKHLLACLLGERWDGVLGGLVKERVVGREEMAGLVV
ncbi:ubiquitin carboxyl-terminal hydrolase family protein [Rutstroemia sp. NJR-2017a BBW]|nr:ubiquitin carboxyl-terminal hydrolase family protein [Rutstroemia sp. NJR-2017a BBW]